MFSDPPYTTGLAQKSLNLVAELNLLNGLIIVEHGAEEILTSNFEVVHKIIYGRTTAIEIFERKLS
ncbi:MAG: RsmD family RNA methyltransferase [Quinella sp. 3Q1]|nr:RsmD family RNA methyltransferase [Quinella sp. 3Q1]MBR6887036.1 RsmD family RNA methyltransferase [Selenomonadaceae bacterium]